MSKKQSAESRAATISFQQLRLFESIGRLESLRRAAEECNLSQPAVTQALAKLEEQAGVTLLKRTFNGSYLNDLGLMFHRRVLCFVERTERALVNLGIPGGQAAAATLARHLVRSKIRIIIAIVENGSLPQAADVLGLSQASLQRAIRDLELDLNKQLYRRPGDGVALTQAAIQFAHDMKLAMQEIESGIAELETAQGAFNSRIAIGTKPAGGSIFLASVVNDFVAAYPNVALEIVNESSAAIHKSLRAGNVDFVVGLLSEAPTLDLLTETISPTRYVIGARRGHPLAAKRKVTIEDLLNFDWVVGLPGSNRRGCFDSLFRNHLVPRAPVATASQSIIRKLLDHSDRLTIMTSYELAYESEFLAEIQFAPLESSPAIGITMRSDWRPTQAHTNFIKLLRRAKYAKLALVRKS